MLGDLVSLLIVLIIAGLIFYVLWWLVGYVGLPEPFNKVARVVIALVAVIVVLYILFGMVGSLKLPQVLK